MAWTPEYSAGAAEPTNRTAPQVDDKYGVAFAEYLRANLAKVIDQFGFWHALGNSFGTQQGVSKQHRQANGADNFITPANDYGGIVTWFTLNKNTNGLGTAQSWLIEDADLSAGVDWRNRLLFVVFSEVPADHFPTQADDHQIAYAFGLDSSAATVAIQSGGSALTNLRFGYFYTEAGRNAGTLPTQAALVLRPTPSALNVEMHASSNASGIIEIGDLIITTLDDGAGSVNARFHGIIFASPQFA